jgi:hypothetical protein
MALFTSTQTITRPNDTTAYTALDVVSTGAGAIIEFANIGVPGGMVLLTEASLLIDTGTLPSGIGQFRVHIFSSTPTPIADNAAFDVIAGDRAKYQGYFDIPTPIDLGATLFSQVDGLRKQFRTGAGGSLFAQMQTLAAFTPTANRVKTLTLQGLNVTD